MHKFQIIQDPDIISFRHKLEEFVNSLESEPIDIKFLIDRKWYIALVHYKE